MIQSLLTLASITEPQSVPDAGTSSILLLGAVAATALVARFLPKK